MKHIHFDPESNGFYGAYWPCEGADCAVITMIGDDPEDRLARSAVKWAFHAARKYPKECRETRKDIEKRMCRVLAEWKGEK